MYLALSCIAYARAEGGAAPVAGDKDYHIESLAMLVTVTFLISMTVLFEKLEEALLEYVEGSRIVVMVEKGLGELTILGFLMFIAFLIEQCGVMDLVSLWLYWTPGGEKNPNYEENAEKFEEQFEGIHFMLFGVMVLFCTNIIILCIKAGDVEKTWADWEALVHNKDRMILFLEDLEQREQDREKASLSTKSKRLGYTYGQMDSILDYMVHRFSPLSRRCFFALPLQL